MQPEQHPNCCTVREWGKLPDVISLKGLGLPDYEAPSLQTKLLSLPL